MTRTIMIAAAAVLFPVLTTFSAPSSAKTVAQDIAADLPALMATYRDLHANPELSFQELRSARVLADAARKAGFTVTEKVGKTGVVAVLRNGPGPTVLIRADMDALPVTELTGLAYASKVRAISSAGVESGVMHACGHDTHMTAWIATARVMAARKAEWSGTLVMIAQPAEELGLGAKAMLEDGLYTRFPKPDYALAFHDTSDIPSGMVGATAGFAMANVDSVNILVKGVGGHGARPHGTRDPVVLAAAIIMRLQTLVSREMDPTEPAVVTVGSIHGGTKHNIIGEEVKLQLTVRSYSDAVRQQLLDGISRITRGEAIAGGMPEDRMPVVTVEDNFTRATFNTPDFTKATLDHLRTALGAEQVIETRPVMGGEDFGEYRRADEARIKSIIFFVGGVPAEALARAKREGTTVPMIHSPLWAPEADKVITMGAQALSLTAMRIMPRGD